MLITTRVIAGTSPPSWLIVDSKFGRTKRQRNIITKYYWLKEEIVLYGMTVYRPLLNLYKQELVEYCHINNIEYSIDSTNLENNHLRNKIRNNILSKYNEEDKENLLKKIIKENKKRAENLAKISTFLEKDKIEVDKFLSL